MTKLVWGEENQKRYEAGVDQGVLYPSNGPGVAWNGLVSVDETIVGGEVNSYYYDGIKYVDLVSSKNFQAEVSAFYAPEEFAPCVGERSVVPGFVLTRQPRERFGLSYKTGLGGRGYKLHLVYNALASSSGRTYSSLSDSPSAEPLSWTIDAVPPRSDTFRPSAHYSFDSTKIDPEIMSILEDYLYGTSTSSARLPSLDELLDITELWNSLIIIPDYASGLSELDSGMGDLYKTKVAGIHRALPNTRLKKTLTSGLYRME